MDKNRLHHEGAGYALLLSPVPSSSGRATRPGTGSNSQPEPGENRGEVGLSAAPHQIPHHLSEAHNQPSQRPPSRTTLMPAGHFFLPNSTQALTATLHRTSVRPAPAQHPGSRGAELLSLGRNNSKGTAPACNSETATALPEFPSLAFYPCQSGLGQELSTGAAHAAAAAAAAVRCGLRALLQPRTPSTSSTAGGPFGSLVPDTDGSGRPGPRGGSSQRGR